MKWAAIVLGFVMLQAAAVYAHTDVTPAEVEAMIDAGGPLTIVDVREEAEYCDSTASPPGHIPGAINMPWYSGFLEEHYTELPLDEDIVVVCRSGGRSHLAATFLDGAGFERIFDMVGGMNAWSYETELCAQASVDEGGGPGWAFSLDAAVPSPFGDRTRMTYTIPEAGGPVSLVIYDCLGRLVAHVVEGSARAGMYTVEWGGTDSRDRPMPSGVYFCRLRWRDESITRRVVLAR
jgi:rhodanese-related sulfurtransferase